MDQSFVDEDNKPVWQWPYSAFGANKPTGILQATPNPRVAITNQPVLLKATAATELNLRFPGQYFDSETNLHYNYFRSYQPNQGRYTQADPIGLEGGLNRFGYVDGDPLSYTDPEGLAKFGGGGKGERGLTRSPSGTPTPYKHMKPHPTDPNKLIYKDPVTGKKIEKPKPADFDKQKGFADPNLLDLLIPWWLMPSPLACATLDCHAEMLDTKKPSMCQR